nr:RHS repeat-associated core domain-containing protein [Brucepastera parasyntrophica]
MPQGGSYELAYTAAGNTTDMPQSRQVLSRVTLRDGLEDSSINSGREYIRRFTYKDGYYDRLVKEFYGFGTVTTRYGAEDSDDDQSRTEVRYYNDAYYSKGMEKVRNSYNENGVLIQSQTQIVDLAPYARVTKTTALVYDKTETGASIETRQRYAYNSYGNVEWLYDDGDTEDTSDDLEARIRYWHDDSKYLHSHPSRIEITDADGRIIRVREGDYNEYGSLETLRQFWAEGKHLTHKFTYDGYGNMSGLTDSAGVYIGYVYDNVYNQYLEEITQTGGGESYVSRIAWDTSRGLKEMETDPNGNTIRYKYDGRGRLIEVRTAYDTGAVPAVSYEYHTPTGARWYAVTSNKITTDGGDDQVMLTVAELDGVGRVRRTAKAGEVYDPGTKSGLRGWNVSGAIEYDGRGRTVKEGQTWFEAGNEGTAGIPALLEKPLILKLPTETDYDGLDRPVKVTLPDGSVSETRYGVRSLDGVNRSYTESVDPLGNTSVQYLDGRDNILRVERWEGDKTKLLTKATYLYNALGELLEARDAEGNPVTVEYDLLGRRTVIESIDSGREESEYNEKGQLWKVTTSVLREKGRHVLYEYDAFGRMVRIDYPESEDVYYTYGGPEAAGENRAGRVIRVEDESGSIEYEYGSLGEVTVETRTLGRRSHDRTGTVKTAEMRYRSDYLGRMEEITYPDGEVVKYEYNYGGEVERVTGEKQGETFTYVDKIGYDEWGQRVYLRLGNGVETTYEYDENRRWLSGIETGKAGTVLQNMSYSFDRVGNVSGYENNAGTYMTKQDYTYDSLYQLTGVTGESRASGANEYQAAYSQSYRFDEGGLGNMMEKVSSSSQSDGRMLGDDLNYSLDYEYETGFVHRVGRIGGRYYRYDASGNLTAEQDGPFTAGDPVNRNYTVTGLGNEVYVTDHGWGMSEDPGGGTGTGGAQSPWKREYTWNERNLLKRSRDSRYTVVYTYGADGERSGKYSVGGSGSTESETLYFNKLWTWRYDGQVSNAAGQNSKHIYVGESRLVTKIGRADGSFTGEERVKQYWYHSDHLGSAQLITNAEGEEYERIEYTPYGELWIEKASTASNIDIPYRFTGKEKDEETGLYYYGARYLDPKTSRWLSTDPALGEYIPGAPVNEEARKRNGNLPGLGGVYNTVNLHLYHYAGNNPVKYTDPTGRNSEDKRTKARDWIQKNVVSNTSLNIPVSRQMYARALQNVNTPYVQGKGSIVAQKMSNDTDNYAYRTIKSRLSDGIMSGSGGRTKWSDMDLTLAINSCEFSWSLDNYDEKTNIATVTVTVTDHFDFNEDKKGTRSFFAEKLTKIGRDAELPEYEVKITYELKIEVVMPKAEENNN